MYIHRKRLDVRVSLPLSSPSSRFKSTSTAAAASACSLRLDVWPHAATVRPWAACSRPLSRGIRPGLRWCFPQIIAARQRLDEPQEPGSLWRSAAMSAVSPWFRFKQQENPFWNDPGFLWEEGLVVNSLTGFCSVHWWLNVKVKLSVQVSVFKKGKTGFSN